MAITDIANSWATGSGNFGLELRAPNEASRDDNWRLLASAEYGGPDEAPKLTATFESFGERTIVNPAGSDGVEVFTAPAFWRRSLPMAEAQAHALDVADTRVANGGVGYWNCPNTPPTAAISTVTTGAAGRLCPPRPRHSRVMSVYSCRVESEGLGGPGGVPGVVACRRL